MVTDTGASKRHRGGIGGIGGTGGIDNRGHDGAGLCIDWRDRALLCVEP